MAISSEAERLAHALWTAEHEPSTAPVDGRTRKETWQALIAAVRGDRSVLDAVVPGDALTRRAAVDAVRADVRKHEELRDRLAAAALTGYLSGIEARGGSIPQSVGDRCYECADLVLTARDKVQK